jgi:two-component sensor histidine kinase
VGTGSQGFPPGDNTGPLRQREAELLAEVTRVRAMVRQCEVDAQHSSDRAAAAELRHGREIDAERAETRLARADAEELRHRLRNTLAIVQAIANATFRFAKPVDAPAAFNARLEALVQAQDILFQSSSIGTNLSSLIKGVLAPYFQPGRNLVRVRGPEVHLSQKPALALALAMHELATNAAKYGALSNEDGYVEITWTWASVSQGKELRLRWHERNGPLVVAPSRKGFGSRLIERNLAAEFNGTVELEFPPNGLVCTICAHLAEIHWPSLVSGRVEVETFLPQ